MELETYNEPIGNDTGLHVASDINNNRKINKFLIVGNVQIPDDPDTGKKFNKFTLIPWPINNNVVLPLPIYGDRKFGEGGDELPGSSSFVTLVSTIIRIKSPSFYSSVSPYYPIS
jgi:hypothetical protein